MEVLRNVLSIAEWRSWKLLAARHADAPLRVPFRPGIEWGGPNPLRSMGPGDLLQTDREEVRRLAERTQNPFLAAFCFDLLWTIDCHHEDGRRSLSPRLEAAALLDAIEHPRDVGFQLGRAFQLAKQLGAGDRVGEVVSAIEDTLMRVCEQGRADVMAHLVNVLGQEWARSTSADPDRFARVLGSLVVGMGRESNGSEPTAILDSLEIAEGFAKAGRQTSVVKAIRRLRLEQLAGLASTNQDMLAAHWAREASVLANDLGDRTAAVHFAAVARERTKDAERNMVTVQTTLEIPAAALAPWERLVRDAASAAEAIRQLATVGRLLELNAPESPVLSDGTPLADTLPIPVVRIRDGKIASRDDASGHRVALEWQRVLATLAWQRLRERSVSTDDLLAAARAPWQSEWHDGFLGRSADAMVRDDYVTAIALAVPRYEAMIREALGAAGGATMKREPDGGERDVLLTKLLDDSWVVASLGADHVRFVRHFLAEPGTGRNLRNELAHGTLRPAECDAGTALLVWLVFVRLVEVLRGPEGVTAPRSP